MRIVRASTHRLFVVALIIVIKHEFNRPNDKNMPYVSHTSLFMDVQEPEVFKTRNVINEPPEDMKGFLHNLFFYTSDLLRQFSILVPIEIK